MIYNVPEPPAGSKISVVPDAYELKLSWGGRRTTARLVLSVVGAAIAAALTVASQLFPQALDLSRLRTWMLNLAIGIGLFAFVLSLVRSYRALAPEALWLGAGHLLHVRGGKSSAAAAVDPPLKGFHWRGPPGRRTVARADVGEFGSGGRDGKAFVTMEVANGGTLDMGWGLGDADREWLVSIIKHWKESPA